MNKRQLKAAMRDGNRSTLTRGLRQAEKDACSARTADGRYWAEVAAAEYRAELNRRR